MPQAVADDGLTYTRSGVGRVRSLAPGRFGGHPKPQNDVRSPGPTPNGLLTLRPAFDGGSRVMLIELLPLEPAEG
jgi:hypothetical protein